MQEVATDLNAALLAQLCLLDLLLHDGEDALDTDAHSNARRLRPRRREHAHQVVVPAPCRDGPDLCRDVDDDDFIDDSRVVVQAAGEGEVEGDARQGAHRVEVGEERGEVLHGGGGASVVAESIGVGQLRPQLLGRAAVAHKGADAVSGRLS
jgi:hypothetical protein